MNVTKNESLIDLYAVNLLLGCLAIICNELEQITSNLLKYFKFFSLPPQKDYRGHDVSNCSFCKKYQWHSDRITKYTSVLDLMSAVNIFITTKSNGAVTNGTPCLDKNLIKFYTFSKNFFWGMKNFCLPNHNQSQHKVSMSSKASAEKLWNHFSWASELNIFIETFHNYCLHKIMKLMTSHSILKTFLNIFYTFCLLHL